MENATKHLFAVSLAENKKNEYFDDTPFTTARISPATREARESGTKELTKMMVKSMKLPLLLGGYVLVGLGLIVLLGFLKALPDTDFMTALSNGKWLLIGGAASAAMGGILLLIHKREQKKQDESEDLPDDMDESLNSLEAISRRIKMELDHPDDEQVTGIEILPYRYKPTADGDTKEVLNSGCFENTEVFFWQEGDYLCVTDYECVQKLPKASIVGYYTVDAKYKISYWWKDEEFNKGEYARFGIKQDSEGNYKLHTYYRVVIREGEDRYEIRVPAYDFDKFQEIVGAACLDGEV
ncbi:MAG: hypothetical protein IJD38_04075 [Clostridia bacterium]|nr:hypothetical protein [Clostridia bacterium]